MEITYCSMPISDSTDQRLHGAIMRFQQFMSGHEQESVLIHCSMGKSRSASIAIAYIMCNSQLSYDKVLSQVLEHRPMIKPNPSFDAQLRKLDLDLNRVPSSLVIDTHDLNTFKAVRKEIDQDIWMGIDTAYHQTQLLENRRISVIIQLVLRESNFVETPGIMYHYLPMDHTASKDIVNNIVNQVTRITKEASERGIASLITVPTNSSRGLFLIAAYLLKTDDTVNTVNRAVAKAKVFCPDSELTDEYRDKLNLVLSITSATTDQFNSVR